MRSVQLVPVLADVAVSVTELKRNPMAVLAQGEGSPVAVLNHNQPACYLVPADLFQSMLDMQEDAELAEIVRARRGKPSIKVSIDEL